MARLNGMYILETASIDLIYGPREQADIESLVNLAVRPQTRETVRSNPKLLENVDVIFSGWGAPRLDRPFLAAAPKLKAFFYAAGSLSSVLSEHVWERGIVLTSAIAANARPVAEYTLATILFSLKHGWQLARKTREQKKYMDRNGAPGCYGATVGLVSLGTTARILLGLLKPFDLNVIVYDPFLTDEEANQLGVSKVGLLDIFERADVVSLHAPSLSETQGMITGEHFESMRAGATFINTARGEIVQEEALIQVARRRQDLQFVLDVVCDEPPEPDSPFYSLPNIILTPHIAGSQGTECRRMGRYMVEELQRFVAGKPLMWSVTPEMTLHTSHRPVGIQLSSTEGSIEVQINPLLRSRKEKVIPA
jgi:phosphoglycerate dehydrogenase-like enzyme